jgi:hypothetical protein
MTYLEDEERRHVFGLPNSAKAVIGVEEFFNDSWYWVNLVYSFVETKNNFSGLAFVIATLADWVRLFLFCNFLQNRFVCLGS